MPIASYGRPLGLSTSVMWRRRSLSKPDAKPVTPFFRKPSVPASPPGAGRGSVAACAERSGVSMYPLASAASSMLTSASQEVNNPSRTRTSRCWRCSAMLGRLFILSSNVGRRVSFASWRRSLPCRYQLLGQVCPCKQRPTEEYVGPVLFLLSPIARVTSDGRCP